MKVTKELVDKIAELAKLEFDEVSRREIMEDMQNILNFMDKLNELDTEGVEPLIYVTEEENRMREDEVKMEITKEEGLKNAPLRDSDYIKAPKVIKKQ